MRVAINLSLPFFSIEDLHYDVVHKRNPLRLLVRSVV